MEVCGDNVADTIEPPDTGRSRLTATGRVATSAYRPTRVMRYPLWLSVLACPLQGCLGCTASRLFSLGRTACAEPLARVLRETVHRLAVASQSNRH